ncbi:MAG: hypothetical protein RL318_1243 [Fibrobacterota bacterium]
MRAISLLLLAGASLAFSQVLGAPPAAKILPPLTAPGTPADSAWLESTEFVDQEIRDVLRAIARAHNLNIFPSPEVKGKVTLTLHRMPVLQALQNLTGLLGYEMVWENGAYIVRTPQKRGSGAISMGISSITLVVESQDIRRFADDYAARTGINLLVDKNAKGTISGRLHNIDPLEGLRAILASNGFSLRPQGEAWIIATEEAKTTGSGFSGSSSRTTRLDIQVRKGLATTQLRNAPLADVLQQLLEGSGYSMVSYGQLGGTVDATFRSIPVLKAIELVLQGTSYTFALRDSTLLIGDRNPAGPSGQVLATTVMVYLRHMRVDKVLPLVPRTLASVALQSVPELNALIISGSIEQIQKVRDFLEVVDQQVPQVVLEAIIVEFTRGNTSELGVKNGPKASDTTSLSGPLAALNLGLSGTKPESFSLNGFKVGTIGVLPQSFMLQLNALEGSNQARVLARPRITTLNGQAANINVGTTDYFQVTTTNTNGVVTSDYRTFNSGITLGITPYVTKSGQITAEIKPEVRTPTSAATSDANRPPSTSTRSISANVRLRNGETLVLGGLIQSLDLTTRTGVPLLSAIPLIGKLFTYRNTQKTTTELAVFITPHVIDSTPDLDLERALDTMDWRVNGASFDRLLGKRSFELPKAVGLPATPDAAPAKPAPDTTKAVPAKQPAAKPLSQIERPVERPVEPLPTPVPMSRPPRKMEAIPTLPTPVRISNPPPASPASSVEPVQPIIQPVVEEVETPQELKPTPDSTPQAPLMGVSVP